MKHGHFLKCIDLFLNESKHVSKSQRLAIDILVGPPQPLTWVAPSVYGSGMDTYGPGANRTIDTLTMINCIFCAKSWIYAWYNGGWIIKP
jgi:hypothetical protein